jgi:nitrate reductase gamma subunit
LSLAITVFIAGMMFRIFSLFLMWRTKDSSAGSLRERSTFSAAVREIIRRLWPQAAYKQRTMFDLVNGYVFHFGLAIIVFALAPHILFIKDLTGLSWGALPNNLIYAVSIITLGSLIAALAKRFVSPPLKIISTFDDWFSWLVTFLPVLTGVIAASHLGARYETLFALHIFSVALLLVWLPFGKLMHFFLVFVTRSQTGIQLSHRGAQL